MNAFRSYLRLTGYGLLAFSRDRGALIWAFVLPAFLVLLFGSLFGKMGETDGKEPLPHFTIGLVQEGPPLPQTAWVAPALHQVPLFTVSEGNREAEMAALRAGKRQALLVFPPDFGARLTRGETTTVRILYDPTQSEITTQTVRGALRQALAIMDQQASGRAPLLTATEEPLRHTDTTSAKASGRNIDYLMPGLIGMTAMQLGLFTAIPLINLREKGVLKRLRAAPVPPAVVVGGQITQRLIVAVAQTMVLLLMGHLVFDFQMICSPLILLPTILGGVITFIGLGITLASLARTQEAAMSLLQLVNLPLMLLSGLMIPRELLPATLRPVTDILPTTYFGDLLRHLMVGANGAFPLSTDLLVLSGWLLLSLLAAIRFFRWE